MASLVSVPTPRMFAGRPAPPPLPSLNGAPPIQLFLSGGRVYVWSADGAARGGARRGKRARRRAGGEESTNERDAGARECSGWIRAAL